MIKKKDGFMTASKGLLSKDFQNSLAYFHHRKVSFLFIIFVFNENGLGWNMTFNEKLICCN